MDSRSRRLFLGLVAAQAAHSVEEYVFRLYDVLAPARAVSSFFNRDPAVGFALANVAIVLFALWCYLARVRTGHRAARSWAWFWTVLEGANGLGHLLFAAGRGGYFPGVATAPLLLGLASWLGMTLTQDRPESGART